MHRDIIDSLRRDARQEAQNLLRWWREKAPDPAGGFHGEIDNDGRPVAQAPKSAILNTRLLWFFSAMDDRPLADRAYDYLKRYFLTPERTGIVWMLDPAGAVIDPTRYAHAQGYALCALAEYHRATGSAEALTIARTIQTEIETRFWNGNFYVDCRDGACTEFRTLGAHLHLLEGHTRLHRIAPDDASRAALHRALTAFLADFAPENAHLPITCEADGTPRPGPVSFGHDAEAAWLLWQAATVLDDKALLNRARQRTLFLTQSTLAHRNSDGGIPFARTDGKHDEAGEWWGQAEALIAFANAWQMTGDPRWLEAVARLWTCLKAQFGAGSGNEWSWYAAGSSRTGPYMAGLWKCPYHTGRAMLELERRLGT